MQELQIIMQTIAALIFAFFSGILVLFQACLALGLPWGSASMGGRFPGKYPPKMRLAALVNMAILAFMGGIILTRAEVLLPGMLNFAKIAVWFVVVFYLFGTVMNTITPSKIERIWAPVALIQFIAGLVVALG